MEEFVRSFEIGLEDEDASACTQVMSGMAIWMSNLARTSSRRQIISSAITYLEVIMPANWTAMYLSSQGHLQWMCRALDAPANVGPWSTSQHSSLGKLAKEAADSRQVIITHPPSREATPSSPQAVLGILYLVPLTVQKRTHGVLAIMDEQHIDPNLNAFETGLVMVISKIIALALDRAELARELRGAATTAVGKRPAQRARAVTRIRKLSNVRDILLDKKTGAAK